MEDKESFGSLNSPQRSLKMASDLKERLRKSARSFSSPVSGVKLEDQEKTSLKITSDASPLHLEILSGLSSEHIKSCNDPDVLQKIHLSLKQEVTENEEKLRKLERIEYYRSKNRPEELIILTERWLNVSQESLRKLYEKLPESKGSFQDFLDMLNIDCSIINYNPESDTFYQ